jgi:PIN domain nuclease of toxin-antitoxin system
VSAGYLFDTHAWLWAQSEPERLPKRVRAILDDEARALFFSVASSWEIATKHGLGRLELPEPPGRYIAGRVVENGLRMVPIEHAHAIRSAELPRKHSDPFDRLLIAQAQLEDLVLITRDRLIKKYAVATLWS